MHLAEINDQAEDDFIVALRHAGHWFERVGIQLGKRWVIQFI